MNLSYEELALLNQMLSVALTSGNVEQNETAKSVHKKITEEIMKRTENAFPDKTLEYLFETEKEVV